MHGAVGKKGAQIDQAKRTRAMIADKDAWQRFRRELVPALPMLSKEIDTHAERIQSHIGWRTISELVGALAAQIGSAIQMFRGNAHGSRPHDIREAALTEHGADNPFELFVETLRARMRLRAVRHAGLDRDLCCISSALEGAGKFKTMVRPNGFHARKAKGVSESVCNDTAFLRRERHARTPTRRLVAGDQDKTTTIV